jgi:hypothetical protein
MPALNFNDIFYGDIFGLILALPLGLFLAFWLSAVKKRAAVVLGAFIGALIPFFCIVFWVGALFVPKHLNNVDGGAVFYGSLLMCAIAALIGGMVTDLIVARLTNRDYRRQIAHE